HGVDVNTGPPPGERRPSVARFFAWGSLALACGGDDLRLKLALVQANADPVARVRLGGVFQRVSASVESDGVPAGEYPQGAQRVEAPRQAFEPMPAGGERTPGEHLEPLLQMSDVPPQTVQHGARMGCGEPLPEGPDLLPT